MTAVAPLLELPAEPHGPAPRQAEGNAAENLPWEQLFEAFFSADLREAERAAAVFSRMIRFWLFRLGIARMELSTEDLVQDVLLELTRSRALIQDARLLGGWLRKTTLHKVSDRWRALQRRSGASPADSLELAPLAALLPDEQVLRKEDRADLLDAIERLPPVLRDCVRLYLLDFSEEQIVAEIRQRSYRVRGSRSVEKHNVKNWLRKARELLRIALSEKRGHG